MSAGEVTARRWRKGVNRWCVYVPEQTLSDGTTTRRERRVITSYSKTEALRWGQERREILIAEHRARLRGELAPKKPKVITFAKFCVEWVKHLRLLVVQGEKKESSIDSIESVAAIHVLPFIGSTPLDQITNSKMESLIAKWCEGGYPRTNGKPVSPSPSKKSLNNRKTIVNACLHYAIKVARDEKRADLIATMPCHIEVGSVESAESSYYDAQTYERLCEGALACDLRSYVAILLAGDAGLRRGEILALKIEDVNFKSGEITVRRNVYWRRARYGGGMVEDTPKGKKAKPVATTTRLLAALRKICAGRTTGRVLVTDDGAQVETKDLRLWIHGAERAAGLPATQRMHVLRHSHLTHLAEAGANLLEIATQARHSDLRITQRYLHAAQGSARSAVARLEQARLATSLQRSPADAQDTEKDGVS